MITLERSYLDNCTIGKMYFKGVFICYTIERPWLNNEKGKSCIPEGDYTIDRYDSSKFQDCFSLVCHDLGVGLTNSYHRNYILIHAGNFVGDIQGCIAPGLDLHPNSWGVSKSQKAMEKLRVLIHNNKISTIKIKRA